MSLAKTSKELAATREPSLSPVPVTKTRFGFLAVFCWLTIAAFVLVRLAGCIEYGSGV